MNDSVTKSVAESVRKVMGVSQLKENVSLDLVNQMKKILADEFAFYFKAHSAHWNVEGSNFPQYHKFFDDLYNGSFAALDPIAEQIRALGAFAPVSLSEIVSAKTLTEFAAPTTAKEMISSLLNDNNKIISGLTVGYRLAEQSGEVGLSNFLQDQIDKHKKTGWMLTSTLKDI